MTETDPEAERAARIRRITRFGQAPFRGYQVDNIDAYQNHPDAIPYTCPDCPAGTKLRASTPALHCPTPGCAHRQKWIHDSVANGTWPDAAPEDKPWPGQRRPNLHGYTPPTTNTSPEPSGKKENNP